MVTVSVLFTELPSGVRVGGLKLQVACSGRPLHAKLTVELNPFTGVDLIPAFRTKAEYDFSEGAEDVAREVGVSKHTIYAWKAKYGGMDVSEAQEAKQLRDENARLKKLVVDLSLDKEMLKAVIAKNGWSS